ncbi:MAG: TRAFs-binding domain-containing protein [Cyclobacteriaceae bacterium]|nr:TRAFs-binding domain-containing protein [Cyclobacteriaceae bacterium]
MNDENRHIEQLINESRYFEAHQEIDVKLQSNPDEERLQQMKALVLSKLGDPKDAMVYFEHRWRNHNNKSESAGIMGSIYKSMFISSEDPKFGKLSANTYLESYNLIQDYYTGINAATMSKITGGYKIAKEIAQQLVDMLLPIARNNWQEASLAEAYLLLKDVDKATEHYIRTREMLKNNWGDVASIKRQLWLINHYTHVPKVIIEFFKPPTIAAFIGHMLDAPDRIKPRFTPSMEKDVRAAIRSSILSLEIQVGYCSLACGSDILFVEEMLSLNREVEIFLPFHIDDFIQTSVAFAGDHWVERFEEVVKKSSQIHYLYNKPYSGDNYQFHLLSELLSGAAILRAKLSQTKPILLAAISEFSLEKKTGGVRDFLNFWPNKEQTHCINIDKYKGANAVVNSTISMKRFKGLQHINTPTKSLSFILTIDSKHIFELPTDHIEYKSLVFKGILEKGKQVFIFTRLAAILRFVKDTIFNKNLIFNGSLVIGFIDNKNKKLKENKIISKAFALCDLSIENAIVVSETVAFLLAMNSDELQIEYSGHINSGESDLSNVYKLLAK